MPKGAIFVPRQAGVGGQFGGIVIFFRRNARQEAVPTGNAVFGWMLFGGHNEWPGFPARRETSIYPQATAPMMDRPEYAMGYLT